MRVTSLEQLNMSKIREFCVTATVLDSVVLAGGWRKTRSKGRFFSASALEQNIETGEWSELPELNIGRRGPSGASLGSKVYIFGGDRESSIESLDILSHHRS